MLKPFVPSHRGWKIWHPVFHSWMAGSFGRRFGFISRKGEGKLIQFIRNGVFFIETLTACIFRVLPWKNLHWWKI